MEFDGAIEGSWLFRLSTRVVDTIEKYSVACDCLAMLD